jgi:hypothetical protein
MCKAVASILQQVWDLNYYIDLTCIPRHSLTSCHQTFANGSTQPIALDLKAEPERPDPTLQTRHSGKAAPFWFPGKNLQSPSARFSSTASPIHAQTR